MRFYSGQKIVRVKEINRNLPCGCFDEMSVNIAKDGIYTADGYDVQGGLYLKEFNTIRPPQKCNCPIDWVHTGRHCFDPNGFVPLETITDTIEDWWTEPLNNPVKETIKEKV